MKLNRLLRPEALLSLLAALFQVKHWSLESHGLRLRGDTSDYVTTIVFDSWYAPFSVVALLFAGAFWLARRFPERGLMPYVCFVSVLAVPLITYKVASIYRVTYFTGNPSCYIAGTEFYKTLLNALLMAVFAAFVVGRIIYLVKLAASYVKDVTFNA
ncbi:hypothetical protein ACQKLP_00615 [Chitinophaga sp. NPDC101104]|uniref:hypothetical protein n=1 Tax=Chitinophaga sp. NPDC101104 TaxID=3390561 RepID=UPI003D091E44